LLTLASALCPWRTAQTLFLTSTLPSALSTWELGNALGLAGEAIRRRVKSLLDGGYVARADDETILLTELGREAAHVFAVARYGKDPPDWARD
jgi:hypothetical protein